MGMAPRSRIHEIFAQVPAPGVYAFSRSHLRLVTDALQGGRRAVVVVAELYEHQIARLEQRQHFVPVALRHECARAGATHGTVDQVDLGGVQPRAQRISPTPLPQAVDTVAAAVADGGIAHQKDTGQRGVGRVGQIEPVQKIFARGGEGGPFEVRHQNGLGRGDGHVAAGLREGADDGVFAQGLQAGDHVMRIEVGSVGVGVDHVARIERLHRGRAHLREAVPYQAGEVDERDALRHGQFAGPLAILAGAALDIAVLPDVAHGERDENRHGALILGLVEGIRRRAASLIDNLLAAGGGDWIGDVADVLPMTVIGDIIGIPEEDRPHIFATLDRILKANSAGPSSNGQQHLELFGSIFTYAAELTAEKRRNPADDIWSTLTSAVVTDENGEQLSIPANELEIFFFVLTFAGSDTTKNALAAGLQAFVANAAEIERYRADEAVRPGAVEEVLRWSTPVAFWTRTAKAAIDMDGVTIPQGSRVVSMLRSANRDEEVFADPFRFDIGRTENPHVTFGGGGPHHCLGAMLARAEHSRPVFVLPFPGASTGTGVSSACSLFALST